MTVYNGGSYLAPAIESVFSQTFKDWELVIVNDGSTDSTGQYLDSLTDARLVIINRENGGTAAAANQGLGHCRGEYTARMDADDISLAFRFAKQIRHLDENREIGLVGTQIAPIGARAVGSSLCLPIYHEEIDRDILQGKHGIAHSSIMFRTQLLKNIGGYWNYRLVDDWDMMLRMGEVTKLANLPDLLHHYRIHRGSLNGKQMKQMRFSIDYACELARRRRGQRSLITLEDFEIQKAQLGLWHSIADSLDLFARCHYRLALAEILGGAQFQGYCRMTLAAACRPHLTFQRIARIVRPKHIANSYRHAIKRNVLS